MIAAGSEVGNAATALRIDPGFRIALERGPETGSALCSQSTILSAAAIPSCRSEAIYARPVVKMRHGTGRQNGPLDGGLRGPDHRVPKGALSSFRRPRPTDNSVTQARRHPPQHSSKTPKSHVTGRS